MSVPVAKIEIYRSTALLHTIENAFALVKTKEILTSGVGTFNFVLPTQIGNEWVYNDVLIGDLCKIWFGYDSIESYEAPFMVGKIYDIAGTGDIKGGYQRVFNGKSLSEILQRRIKTKRWVSYDASDIVTELANNLNLGTEQITSDTTDVTLQIEDETFFGVLQDLSDFWNVDTGLQINKDFYVAPCNTHANGDLVWKVRPFHDSSNAAIPSFTIGDNIVSYVVTRDKLNIINKLHQYGAPEKRYPSDGDAWTEGAVLPDGWTSDGTIHTTNAAPTPKVGSWQIHAYKPMSDYSDIWLQFTFPSTVVLRIDALIHFFCKCYYAHPNVSNIIKILCPDTSNYYYKTISNGDLTNYEEISHDFTFVGEEAWSLYGNPNWQDAQALRFEFTWDYNPSQVQIWIDGLYFDKLNYLFTAEDSASQTSYDIHERALTDVNLKSDAECESRGKTIISQKKDPSLQIEIVTPGNVTHKGNRGIMVGDRVPLVVPSENLSANFDTISVEHSFGSNGFLTSFVASSIERQREKAYTSPQDVIRQIVKDVDGLSRKVNR
jgi:hypothetical protein